MKRSILIVDDDTRVATSVARTLTGDGYIVACENSAETALARLTQHAPQVVLSDVRMPGMSGLEFLRLLRERMPAIGVVLMSAYHDLPVVAEAMREGAVDFLMKPLEAQQLRTVVGRVFEDRALRKPETATEAPTRGGPTRLVGGDARMVEIFKVIGQVASTRTNVLIRGESGTGKELVARAIHSSSVRAKEAFVAVNCTAIPGTLLESELFGHVKGAFTGATSDRRGRFALAGSGSIFLDEIGDTTPEFQAKLLRVLQEHEYYPVGSEKPERTEARVIAATHRNLERMIEEGRFREDLYYRLRVVELVVPPLRERINDIPLLADHLVAKASHNLGREPAVLTKSALDALLAHSWPGNVRELENCLTRAVVLAAGDVVRPEHLSLSTPTRSGRSIRITSLDLAIRDHIVAVLEASRGNKSRAARILRVSRPRLDRLIKRYRLTDPNPEGGQ